MRNTTKSSIFQMIQCIKSCVNPCPTAAMTVQMSKKASNYANKLTIDNRTVLV